MSQTKKLQEWWTEDVDGGCIIFYLYRNTENLIVLLKRWRGDFRKGEYCQTFQQKFYLEELAQIELTQNQNNGRAYDTKIEDKEHHFDNCFDFETNAGSRFVRRLSYNRLSKFKNFRLFIIQYTNKKTIKKYMLVISIFTG